MSMKKLFVAIVLLLTMIAAVPSVSVAEFIIPTEPIERAKMIQVELNDYYFHPKNITISKNEPTTFRLKNSGSFKHTFTVKDLNVDIELEPGKEKTITIKPKKDGTYELICRFHTKEGMVGKIIVK